MRRHGETLNFYSPLKAADWVRFLADLHIYYIVDDENAIFGLIGLDEDKPIFGERDLAACLPMEAA